MAHLTEEIQRMALDLQAYGIALQAGQPLAAYTTFRIGGQAALFCMPENAGQLARAVTVAKKNDVPYFFLGKGSNVLFCDEGYDGLIIHVSTGEFGAVRVEGNCIYAGAGVSLMDVCMVAAEAGLSGLEFAYGIPGSVGGAVYMNAGAYDGEISKVLQRVDYLDETETLRVANVEEAGLDYRSSVFQRQPWCITGAQFCLRPGNSAEIMDHMQHNMRQRVLKQPLELPSAGSTFKRPAGAFAGALIDQVGLRGYRVGDAAISEKHCGFIVNLGHATCADVLRLADEVVCRVQEGTGVVLEKEIRVVGSCCNTIDVG